MGWKKHRPNINIVPISFACQQRMWKSVSTHCAAQMPIPYNHTSPSQIPYMQSNTRPFGPRETMPIRYHSYNIFENFNFNNTVSSTQGNYPTPVPSWLQNGWDAKFIFVSPSTLNGSQTTPPSSRQSLHLAKTAGMWDFSPFYYTTKNNGVISSWLGYRVDWWGMARQAIPPHLLVCIILEWWPYRYGNPSLLNSFVSFFFFLLACLGSGDLLLLH